MIPRAEQALGWGDYEYRQDLNQVSALWPNVDPGSMAVVPVAHGQASNVSVSVSLSSSQGPVGISTVHDAYDWTGMQPNQTANGLIPAFYNTDPASGPPVDAAIHSTGQHVQSNNTIISPVQSQGAEQSTPAIESPQTSTSMRPVIWMEPQILEAEQPQLEARRSKRAAPAPNDDANKRPRRGGQSSSKPDRTADKKLRRQQRENGKMECCIFCPEVYAMANRPAQAGRHRRGDGLTKCETLYDSEVDLDGEKNAYAVYAFLEHKNMLDKIDRKQMGKKPGTLGQRLREIRDHLTSPIPTDKTIQALKSLEELRKKLRAKYGPSVAERQQGSASGSGSSQRA